MVLAVATAGGCVCSDVCEAATAVDCEKCQGCWYREGLRKASAKVGLATTAWLEGRLAKGGFSAIPFEPAVSVLSSAARVTLESAPVEAK